MVRKHTVPYVTEPELTPQRSRTGVIAIFRISHREIRVNPNTVNLSLSFRAESFRAESFRTEVRNPGDRMSVRFHGAGGLLP